MKTHGMTNTPECVIWRRIKQRCLNPGCSDWPGYGGRGVVICPGLADSFPRFLAVVGPRPPGRRSIDRADNDGGYTCGACGACLARGWPLNVRWATPSEQMRNTRASIAVTFGGRTQNLKAWAEETGIKYDVLHQRLVDGWTAERALTTPARRRGVNARGPTPERRKLRLVWRAMVSRCHRPGCREFRWYGAKGVSVCAAWRESFEAFLADVGPRPGPEYTLDRFPDPAGNYEPGNVRWATAKEQAANKRAGRARFARVIPRHLAG